MDECQNVSVRERLPEYVHGTLDDEAEYAVVRAHVDLCGDCARELAVIEATLASAPRPAIDVAAIVAAIPAYRAGAVPAPLSVVTGGGAGSPAPARRWFRNSHVQLAAGLVIAAAGLSVVAVRHPFSTPTAVPSVPVASSVPDGGVALVNVSDLSDDNLAQLIQSMGDLDDAPPAEPEMVSPSFGGGEI